MAKMKSRRFSICLVLCSVFVSFDAFGGGLSTQRESWIYKTTTALQLYAERHNGELPPDVDHLFPGSSGEDFNDRFGGISTKIIYLGDSLPKLEDGGDAKIIAMIAFPISDDRRNGIGRYVVLKEATGEIHYTWKSEKMLQASLAKSNITISDAPVYEERPLRSQSPEYGIRLVEDAVKQGVPIEKAAAIVAQHVDDVYNRRAKEAKTWAEVLANYPPGEPQATPFIDDKPATPQATVMPQSTPQPAISETPTKAAEKLVEPFSIVAIAIGLVVVLGIGFFLFNLRRK